jgi:hypothetical protein
LYEISDRGRVRSLRGRVPRIMKTAKNDSGYPCVRLSLGRSSSHERVHRLVLAAFFRPPESGEVCRHIDGMRDHNCAANLTWGTKAENYLDSVRHGTAKIARRGGAHPCAKLTDEQREAITDLLRSRYLQRDIAVLFGVSTGTISYIARTSAPDVAEYRKTHCSRGHEMNEKNFRYYTQRMCRACQTERQRARRAAQKAVGSPQKRG